MGPNKALEAEKVFGADDLAHPAVNYLHNKAGKVYLGGPITGLTPPVHYDFKARRDTPNELAPSSARWAGAGSWPSRPATRSTARTRS
jgi:ATP sulfurylase